MVQIRRVVLDILKPHHPNILELAKAIAALDPGCRVSLTVHEMDDKTETIEAVIEGGNVDFPAVVEAIKGMGASLHSIDAVEVAGGPESLPAT